MCHFPLYTGLCGFDLTTSARCFMIFDPKKGGVILSTFLTPPHPQPPHPHLPQNLQKTGFNRGVLRGSGPKTLWGMRLLDKIMIFFSSNGPVHNVPRATVGQVRSKVQISAKPGCAYGLQLMTAPPWFPIEVVVVMSLVFPTRLDPRAFCGVLVVVASGLPTRWGPNVPAAVSVSGISSVVLAGLLASIVSSYVCRRHGSTASCLPSVSAGATCRVSVVGAGPAASRCRQTASGIDRRSAAAVLPLHTISLCRTLLVHTIAGAFGIGVRVCPAVVVLSSVPRPVL